VLREAMQAAREGVTAAVADVPRTKPGLPSQ
jgi:hypothetical protein